MAVNPYFKRNKIGEQNLLQSLTNESIKIHGVDVIYIPRETVTEDFILGEEVSQFKDANKIEMYLEGSEIEGDSEMARFGLDIKESATFVVSKQRFLDVMSHNTDIREKGRPREGDLIYFDLPGIMLEIKFVEHEQPFFPAGSVYSFKLVCEAFKYSHEKVDTGESEIDNIMKTESSYLLGITLGSGIGTYLEGEDVYSGTVSNKTALGSVNKYVATGTKYLYVNVQSGSFNVGGFVIGTVSGASYGISGTYNTTIVSSYDGGQDNDKFDLDANSNSIFDFTEKDPFSEGGY